MNNAINGLRLAQLAQRLGGVIHDTMVHGKGPEAYMQTLTIRNFAHLAEAHVSFGDLTILVGPQNVGIGKSLTLQWLKLAIDGRHVTKALRDAGYRVTTNTILDLVFGNGMGPAWRRDTVVEWQSRKITPTTISRQGSERDALFFIPAHRAMLISDGWATPFHKLSPDVPVVARLFSQHLFERFTDHGTGTVFPGPRQFKKARIDHALFQGGTVSIEEDIRGLTRRLRLLHGGMRLPPMTWSVGQRECTPLLVGLHSLVPHDRMRKRDDIDWVVIEEPETGLHAQAITAVLLLVLDLLWRGYRVVLSTQSPHIVAAVWALHHLKKYKARWQLVCDAFAIQRTAQMREIAEGVLRKTYRVHAFSFDTGMRIRSRDISPLPGPVKYEDAGEIHGLMECNALYIDAMRQAVKEAKNHTST